MNELRRKKKDDKALSKRIKSLVRKWQEVANEAGINLKQPLNIPSTVNGKHEYNSINSPQLPINGKLKNNVEKISGLDNENSSSVKFIVSTPSPGFNYASQIQQNIPNSNGSDKITSSPIVNSPSQSYHNPVTPNLLTKNTLSVINGYSNKLPTTPTTPSCDIKESTLQKASKKRKAEALSPGSVDSVTSKKLKSSFNNDSEGSIKIKNKFEKSFKNELYINESSNDSTFNRSQHNGFFNGDNYEDKVFSCNSTGNLKCTISRSRLVQTPPITPSFHSSPQTPINKQRSIATPPIPSSLNRSKTTVKTKTVNTPPIQSSKLKFSNTPPIPNAFQLSQKTLKKSATASTPLHETPKSLVKNSKVETTAQILQKLHSNNNLPLAQSLEKISSNRIKKEKSDDDEVSVIPASIKPRGHKRRSKLVPPQSNAREVAQAKNERMQIFLHSSNLSSNNFNEVKKEDPKIQDTLNVNSKKGDINKLNKVKFEDEEIDISKLDPSSAQYKAALLRNPWAFLPPIINDDDESGGEKDTVDNQKEENEPNNCDIEERLNKLSLQKWSGVNGVEDGNGDFKDWTSSYSIKMDDEYRHILPYVCL